MGNARWSTVDWSAHATRSAGVPIDKMFKSRSLREELDPAKFSKRESVASEKNPRPTPMILGSDVTGSMGETAEYLVKDGLGVVMQELYDSRPVSDPQILYAAIGDSTIDEAPIQATQFEADMRIVDQMKNVYIERGGGGNGGESYALAWAFAAYKTRCDAIKSGRKGYLFTIGDECCLPSIPKEHLKRFMNLDAQVDMDSATLLADVQKDWHVFHLIVRPVSSQPVLSSWRDLLGERAIVVKDMKHLAHGVAALVQCVEGMNPSEVSNRWDGDRGVVVRDVVAQLVRS